MPDYQPALHRFVRRRNCKHRFSERLIRKDSYARPGKLFTANSTIIIKQIGELNSEKLEEIIRAIILLLEKSIA